MELQNSIARCDSNTVVGRCATQTDGHTSLDQHATGVTLEDHVSHQPGAADSPPPPQPNAASPKPPFISTRFHTLKTSFLSRTRTLHSRIPYLQHLPLRAILVILSLILINIFTWLLILLILLPRPSTRQLLSTAALAYTLGLRHALDADHISAIDLMTRRLIATGQRPVTVGTFFSLGHSTIVVVTSIVVAATAAGVSRKFDGFSSVGGIVGSSVSAGFLILLGGVNAYILYRLVIQLRKVVSLSQTQIEEGMGWEVEGGGVLFRILKGVFRLVDRPWKMYPVGVVFGLGFDTSSEIALLGISSIQASRGTSIWLILVFPVLFTVGMCLVDTIDGALMMGLYVAPLGLEKKEEDHEVVVVEGGVVMQEDRQERRVKDPLLFLYYSVVLTALTVMVALVIGTIQLLTMILNVAKPEGKFWDGVQTAGDNYEVIGGGICASFVVVGGLSVLCYKPWRRWIEKKREKHRTGRESARADERLSLTLEQSRDHLADEAALGVVSQETVVKRAVVSETRLDIGSEIERV